MPTNVNPSQFGVIDFNYDKKSTAFVSERFSNIFGYTKAELSPLSFDKFSRLLCHNPEDAGKLSGILFDEFIDKTFYISFAHKDGEEVYVEFRCVAANREDTRLIACGCTRVDKGTRKSTQALAKAEFATLGTMIPCATATLRATKELDILYANDKFYSMLNYTREQVAENFDNKLINLIYEDDVFGIESYFEENQQNEFALRCRLINSSGALRWINFHTVRLEYNTGDLLYQSLLIDETETVEALNEAETSRRELEGIAYSIPGSISKIRYKEDGTIEYLFLSNGLQNLAGYTPDDEEYFNISKMITPEDAQMINHSIQSQLEYSGYSVVYRIQNKDKTFRWVKENASLLEFDGENYIFICIYIDITNVKLLQIESDSENKRLQLLLSVSEDTHFQYDITSDFMSFMDRKMAEHNWTTNWTVTRYLKSEEFNLTIHPDDISNMKKLITGDESLGGRYEFRYKPLYSDEYIWCAAYTTPTFDNDGQVTGIVGIFRDIHQQKLTQIELSERSKHDELTGLLNRENAEIEIHKFLQNTMRRYSAMVIIDINNFKSVNTEMGTAYANNMLKTIAKQIIAFAPEDAVCSRIGGDEFLIFIKDCGSIDYVTQLLQSLYDSVANVYSVESSESLLKMGVKLIPPTEGNYADMVQKADIALQKAKIDGDIIVVYSDDIELPQNIDSTKLYKSIENTSPDLVMNNTFLMEIMNLLLFSKDSGSAIQTVLGIIGQKFDFDRAYIFDTYIDNNTLNKSLEWCREGVSLDIDVIRNISLVDGKKSYEDMFDEDDFFYCDDIKYMRHWKSIYDDWIQNNVHLSMQFAIREGDYFNAMIGFDSLCPDFQLNDEDFNLLRSIAKIAGTFILRRNSKTLRETDQSLSRHIIQHMDLQVHIVDVDTYEVRHVIQKNTNSKFALHEGEICYKTLCGLSAPCRDCPVAHLSDEAPILNGKMYNASTNKWLDVNASLIHGSNGTRNAVVSLYDVTKYVEKISDNDTLTSSATLSKFERAAQEIINANPFKRYAVIYLDIYQFRVINQTYGYATGDTVLIETANAMAEIPYLCECFGRITDDKFIMLSEVSSNTVLKDRCLEILDSIYETVTKRLADAISSRHLIYIAGVYEIKQGNQEIAAMMDKAHYARKSIRTALQHSVAIYDQALAQREDKNNQIEKNMSIALQTHEFRVFLQPKYSLIDKKLIGAEALVRWIPHDGSIIYPDEFIPLFEQNGFIIDLDYYIYEETFKIMRYWIDNGVTPCPISVNVSRAHIDDDDFILDIFTLVQKYEIPLELVELELTESMFLSSKDRLIEIIQQLRELGFTVSIDDFGSGYSSLNLLKDLSFDILKLDKSFLDDSLLGNENILIKSIINLAHELKMEVICEGVETEKQADFLQSINCDFAQGYLFSRPIPASEFSSLYYNLWM